MAILRHFTPFYAISHFTPFYAILRKMAILRHFTQLAGFLLGGSLCSIFSQNGKLTDDGVVCSPRTAARHIRRG
jgi:hypothetical protein